jgi:hypothetical protein
MRPLLLLCLVPLLACPPVRDPGGPPGDDDDATTPDPGDLESVWEATAEGACDVIPDSPGVLLPDGAGRATNGLWYDVGCYWTGGNASEILIEVPSFDERSGGDFEVDAVIPRDTGGAVLALEGDLGELHLLPAEVGRLDGWWSGDLSGTDASGATVRLEAVVFRGAQVDSVVGR